ncbi:MAG: cytochrome c biogenesis protein CcsA, partial [Chloroflexota bacterium]
MNAQLGVIFLFLALASTLYALVASLIGARNGNEALVESARNATIVVWPLLTAAALTLISLMVRGDFSVEYVWSVTDLSMPTYLKVTALWGGQAGSLLFWGWLMSTYTTVAMLRNWKREHRLMPYVVAATSGTLAFFILLVTFWENPFATFYQSVGGTPTPAMFGPGLLSGVAAAISSLAGKVPGLLGTLVNGLVPLAAPRGAIAVAPANGNGLNPLLRHPGMIIHPPMLYLGFTGFVIPYSFGMAALATGEVSDSWIRATRRWTLIAWMFLSIGLILGGWWAYDVLGWGGYWGWDPVENAAFMPWLTGTAFLHSVMIQEKRGMLKRWNMVLIMLTYLQVVLGTFATRSGFVSSVHSFAQSAIGPLFFLFLVAAMIISVALLIRRWDDLAAENQLDSLLSRETFFLLNNLL